MYQLSLPGGGFVSFTDLVEVLGIIGDTYSEENDEEIEEHITDGMLDITASEAAKKFVADVESVEFSSPELAWVGKVDAETTVGAIKDALGLECEYSADLTKKEIEVIDQTPVKAGDWAFISLKAFDSEEYLTVTMKDGDTFRIRVTDAKPSQVTGLNTSGLDGKFTVNMFNYGPSDKLDKEKNNTGDNGTASKVQDGINAYTDLDFMAYGNKGTSINSFTGDNTIRQGIVANTLSGSGYPYLSGKTEQTGGLDSLFNTTSDGTTKQVYENVTGLFYKSNVDGTANTSGSYYSYDSDRYYAYMNSSKQIEFYKQYNFGNNDKDVTNDKMNGKPVGFFPFTVPDDSQLCPHPNDVGWSKQHPNGKNYGANGSGYYDHQFGLTLSGNFMIPENKMVDNQDMVFKFSGDDDMWVFIDDVLVLDIGGIHHPSSGQIDFTTGKVTVDNGVTGVGNNKNTINMSNGNKVEANISTIFQNAGKKWDNSEYSSHTIKVFYLERGGIYSNCKITFNIPLVLGAGEVTIVKKDEETGTDQTKGFLQGAKFGIWKNADCTGDPIVTGTSGTDGKLGFSKLAIEDENTKYYLKEIEPPTGYLKSEEIFTLSVGTKQSNNMYSFNITDSKGNAVATIGQEPALPMISNKPSKITAVKEWRQGEQPLTGDAASGFQVKLTLMKNGQLATSSDTSNEITQTVSGNGTATWHLKNANVDDYTVKETAVKLPWMNDFETISGSSNPYGGTVSGSAADGYTVTNTIPTTEISVTKQWKDGTPQNADHVFEVAKQISFTLYQKLGDGEPTVYTAYGTNGKGTVSYVPSSKTWSTEVINSLPAYVYNPSSKTWEKASYYVVEDEMDGVNITYKKGEGEASTSAEDAKVSEDDSASPITIINTDIPATFNLIKVEKGKHNKVIPDAEFTLRKVKAAAPFDYAEDESKAITKTTNADGKITFENLTEGYYEVKETKIPDGYVNAGQPAFYIRVQAGKVSLVEKDGSSFKESTSVDDGKFTFTAAAGQTPAQVTVENEPGAALPNTGGPGTRIFTILGSILILGAGVLLWRRRRLV